MYDHFLRGKSVPARRHLTRESAPRMQPGNGWPSWTNLPVECLDLDRWDEQGNPLDYPTNGEGR
jgi:hypothetical protein